MPNCILERQGESSMPADQFAKPKFHWLYPTPGRLPVLLLAVEAVLLLSERFRWFPFNEKKGWTVLIAMAAIGVFLFIMLLWFIVSLFCRWRFQFSIRSLLVLTIVVAIPICWLSREIKWANDQKETVEAIRKMGGMVLYDEKFDKSTSPPVLVWFWGQLGNDFFGNVFSVDFIVLPLKLNDLQEVSDPGLECLNRLTQLHSLSLSDSKISDAGVKHLKGLTQLQSLELNHTSVSDAGMEHLKDLTQLKYLNLSNTRVSDAGMKHLEGLTQLQELDLSNTGVSDAGVKRLKGLTQLQELNLGNTRVSDVGVEHLKGMTQLQRLKLRSTRVSDVGMKHLKGLTQLQELNL
jgi:hypothetical protein